MSVTSSSGASPEVRRVSTIELFFDLVFVFTLTQLTDRITHPQAPTDYLKTIIVFMTLMWIYDGYAWLTSNIELVTTRQRQLVFLAMAGFFVMALSIPRVFAESGLPYALGLLVVTCVHSGLFLTVPGGSARAILRAAPFNFAAVFLVLAAAFVDPPWDWPFWLAAAAVLLAAVFLRRESGFDLSPSHFVERHGLLIIVALGESIVAVGVGARDLALDAVLIAFAVLALFLSTALWWIYFDRDDRRAEHSFQRATRAERVRMAIIGFGLAHFAMIFGIILLAAGLKVGIAHPTGPSDPVGALNLSLGLALYLAGDAIYRRALLIGPGRLRLLIAALLIATIPLGIALGALVQLAVCALLFVPLWIAESKQARGDAR